MSERKDDSAILLLVALVIVLIIGGGFVFLLQRGRAMRAMAEEQRAKAVQMEAMVRSQAAAAEAESQRGGATLKESLDQAAAKLDEGAMKDQPGAAAGMHAALGESYLSINELDAAEKHFKAALDLRIKAEGESGPNVAKDRENLARIAQLRGK